MIRETAQPKEPLGMSRSTMRLGTPGHEEKAGRSAVPGKRAGVSFLQVRLDGLLKNRNSADTKTTLLPVSGVHSPWCMVFPESLEGRLVATNAQPFPVSPR